MYILTLFFLNNTSICSFGWPGTIPTHSDLPPSDSWVLGLKVDITTPSTLFSTKLPNVFACLFYLCDCFAAYVHVYICTTYLFGFHGSQKRVSDPLGLESQGVTDPCELVCECRKSSLGPPQEQVLFFTPDPKVQLQTFHFLPCVYFKRFQISENFVENIFPLLNCLKDELSRFVWIYVWILYPVSLVQSTVLLPVPHCFDYCSII